MSAPIVIGARYGEWDVLECLGRRWRTSRHVVYRCRCGCGTFGTVTDSRLRRAERGLGYEACRKCARRKAGKVVGGQHHGGVHPRRSDAELDIAGAPCAACGLRGPHECLRGDASAGLGVWRAA